MASISVTVSDETAAALTDLTARTGESVPTLVGRAAKDYRDKLFWDEANAAYAALRADPAAWADFQAERRAWDATLGDGLDPDEYGPVRSAFPA